MKSEKILLSDEMEPVHIGKYEFRNLYAINFFNSGFRKYFYIVLFIL